MSHKAEELNTPDSCNYSSTPLLQQSLDAPFATDTATTAPQLIPSASTIPEATPPNVTIFENGGTQIAGENYTLTCQVTGGETTPILYQWFKNGSLLTSEESSISSKLFFSPLNEADSGVYTCEVNSGNESVTITVVGKF